jgi:hypothetical protein
MKTNKRKKNILNKSYLEIIAIGVIANDFAIIVCDIPGISFVITSRVA